MNLLCLGKHGRVDEDVNSCSSDETPPMSPILSPPGRADRTSFKLNVSTN